MMTPRFADRFSQAGLSLLLLLFLAATALSLQGAYPPYEDDAYIYLRYARHLAAGQGPVWNVGQEPVEGYTSALYQAVLTATDALGWDAATRAGWLGIGASLLTLALTWLLANRLNPGRPLLNLLAPLLLALSKEYQYWTTAGMETPIYALMLVAAALATVDWQQGRGPVWLAGLLWALAGLARPEALALFGLTVPFAFVGRWRHRTAVDWPVLIGVFLAVVLPYHLWRWLALGYAWPNTYYAKTGGEIVQLRGGLDYVAASVPALFQLGPLSDRWPVLATLLPAFVVVLVGMGLFLSPRRRDYGYLTALLLGMALIVVVNGGDHFARARFLTPALPFVAALLPAALAAVAAWRPKRSWQPARPWCYGRRLPVVLAGLVVALLLAGWGLESRAKVSVNWADIRRPAGEVLAAADARRLTKLNQWGLGFILMGQTLADIAAPDQSVAAVPIGAIGFFSDRRVFDMVGIVDPVIAHQPLDPAYTVRWRPGHDKGDGGHILRQEPDFIQLVDRLTSQPYPGPDDLSLRYKSIVEILNSPVFYEQYEFCAIPVARGWYYNLYRRRATTEPCDLLRPAAAAGSEWPLAGVIE